MNKPPERLRNNGHLHYIRLTIKMVASQPYVNDGWLTNPKNNKRQRFIPVTPLRIEPLSMTWDKIESCQSDTDAVSA